jgi:hypothetical protein
MQQINPDPEIEKAFKWFLELIPPADWSRRKEAIETYLHTILEPKSRRENAKELKPVSITDDRMGWYLYLVETSLYSPYKYEPIQGSRVLPIFKRFGSDFQKLVRISGAKEKALRLVTTDRTQPDSGMFELLTALLWARNGWADVELLTEMPPTKRPDIRAANNREEWFVECKRLTTSSEYSQLERKKWLKMWHNFRDILIDKRLPYILDVIFHVELETLPDNFLRDELSGKLRQISPPCKIISNGTWEVAVSEVDFATAREHLRRYFVKNPSDQLNELIAGRRNPNKGFTCLIEGETV